MLEVFWGSGSGPAWRVLLACAVKKIPYESRLLSFQKREHKSDEITALNPRGKVPVIRDGGYALYESLAILAYLDAKYPGPVLFGTTPERTGLVWRTVMEHESYGLPAIQAVTRPLLFNTLDESRDAMPAHIETLHAELARLEGQLGEGTWLVGGEISAADLAVYPGVHTLLRAAGKPAAEGLALNVLPLATHYPKLGAWLARIDALPGVADTYPPHWKS